VEVREMKKQLMVITAAASLMLGLWACSKAPTTYYPLGEGLSWTYQISMRGLGGAQSIQETITNLAARDLKGRKVTPRKFEAQVQGQSHSEFQYDAEDARGVYTFAEQQADDVEPKLKEPWAYALKQPLKVGNTWPTTIDLGNNRSVPAIATIESTDEVVDVPSGTFKGCIRVHSVGMGKGASKPEAHYWYAPSVGLVKSIEPPGSAQLVAFKK